MSFMHRLHTHVVVPMYTLYSQLLQIKDKATCCRIKIIGFPHPLGPNTIHISLKNMCSHTCMLMMHVRLMVKSMAGLCAASFLVSAEFSWPTYSDDWSLVTNILLYWHMYTLYHCFNVLLFLWVSVLSLSRYNISLAYIIFITTSLVLPTKQHVLAHTYVHTHISISLFS